MSMHSCTVRVTIFGIGGKFRPVLNLVTHSYSSRPFLCALAPILLSGCYLFVDHVQSTCSRSFADLCFSDTAFINQYTCASDKIRMYLHQTKTVCSK